MVDKRGQAAVAVSDGGPRAGKRALLVAHRIVGEIGAGAFAVGDKLAPEKEMLERYGVARATLREALRFLELQGVIDLKPGPGGGPVIRVPEPHDFASTMALTLHFVGATFRSLIEVRQALGPTTAAQAAERAAPDDIAELRTSLAALSRHPGDSLDYVEENRRFHDLLAFAGQNPLIGFLTVALHHITTASGIGMTYSHAERQYQLKAYERILASIEDRNPEEASKEMHRFMRRSDSYLEKRYPDLMAKRVRWDDAGAILSGVPPAAVTANLA